MKLRVDNDIFILDCTFKERNVPKEARFWWNSDKKRWETKSRRCAVKLIRYATQEVRDRIIVLQGRPLAGRRLSQVQAIAHRQHIPRPSMKLDVPAERLPVRDLEGLTSLYEKYRESIQAGHRFQERLGEE